MMPGLNIVTIQSHVLTLIICIDVVAAPPKRNRGTKQGGRAKRRNQQQHKVCKCCKIVYPSIYHLLEGTRVGVRPEGDVCFEILSSDFAHKFDISRVQGVAVARKEVELER